MQSATKTSVATGYVIPAYVYSDDRLYTVPFDAVDYFKTCTQDDVAQLACCGWGGDYPADRVAQHVSQNNPEVERMLDYVTRKNMGFECSVDPVAAKTWLCEHRPEIVIREPEE